MSDLLSTDPKKRPTAEEMLLRLNEEGKICVSSEPQHHKRVEQDDDDSDYCTLDNSNHQPKPKQLESESSASASSPPPPDSIEIRKRQIEEIRRKLDASMPTSPDSNVKSQEKMNPIKSERSGSPVSMTSSPVRAVRQQHPNVPFLLISSRGPSADHQSAMFGLYRKSAGMTEGDIVYLQECDYEGNNCRLFSSQGVWTLYEHSVCLRAATPSEDPTAVLWQYQENIGLVDWWVDPWLTVTSLSEKPSDCEITISLSTDIFMRNIQMPGLAGVYTADGSYCGGRPVLRHSGGLFTLHVSYWGGGYWVVSAGAGGNRHLVSGSAPTLCPADPRAARSDTRAQTHWRYLSKLGEWAESREISVKCSKHYYH